MPKKRTAEALIEELARVVKRGFDEVATKRDLESLATKEQLQLVADNVDLLRADAHDIKLTLGPLVRHAAAMERDVMELKKRMDRVERKMGMAR